MGASSLAGGLPWVCLGGAVGSGLRYLLVAAVTAATAARSLRPGLEGDGVSPAGESEGVDSGLEVMAGLGASIPWGTLACNVLGALALSALAPQLERFGVSEGSRLALTTGLLGGFTTYSAFNHETLTLLNRGAWRPAALYLGLTLTLCLLAGALGFSLGRLGSR